MTNRFKISLLNVVGLAGLDTTFHVAFVFLRGEQEAGYHWALQQPKEHLPTSPKIFFTDRELPLMNAIAAVFSDGQHLLCQWHIQKNILAKCKRYFQPDTEAAPTLASSVSSMVPVTATDPWTEFHRTWTPVIEMPIAEGFEKGMKAMKEKYKARIFAIRYIEAMYLVTVEGTIRFSVD